MGATLSFTQALIEAESQARRALPATLHERLAQATELVRGGRVFQDSAGAWQVGSTTQDDLTYSVNSHCDCQDYQYNRPPMRLCKHRLAMFLSQRVLSLMTAPVPPAEPAPEDRAVNRTIQPLYEAPSSVNCHIVVDGRQVQLTLRDSDEQRLLERLTVVLKAYPAPQAAPASAPSPGQAGWCQQHQVQMRQTTKEGQSWWSHKTPEGWCKGR
jgi:hypothetical protein